jgi:hypothetical protein
MTIPILDPIYVSFVFLVVNVVILLAILVWNRLEGDRSSQADRTEQESPGQKLLKASDILGWEFEYARTTASEAMQDRHTMVNFYLLVAGIVTSGVVAVLGQDADANLPKATGTALLWLLCGIGWLYFLKLIRFRQAWHDSARAMNQIKDFYVQHAKDFEPDVLRDAFRWKTETLPPPDKPWTAYFYSAMLIGFLDSIAYVAGGALLALDVSGSFPWPALWPLPLFGLAFFAFHVWLYFAFLKGPSSETAQHVQSKDE